MDLLLTLKRSWFTDKSTIGLLSIEATHQCLILEDKDRNLTSTMSLDEINKVKVFSETCIPYGKYEIIISKSNRFSQLASTEAGHPVEVWLPEVLNVPGWEGVRIHSGNRPEDTEGCLLPGISRSVDLLSVNNSRDAFKPLFAKIQEAINNKNKVFIEIIK